MNKGYKKENYKSNLEEKFTGNQKKIESLIKSNIVRM